jgi:hypothetical protein
VTCSNFASTNTKQTRRFSIQHFHVFEYWVPRAVNPLNAELNPICHLPALLGGTTIVVVSRIRVNIVGRMEWENIRKRWEGKNLGVDDRFSERDSLSFKFSPVSRKWTQVTGWLTPQISRQCDGRRVKGRMSILHSFIHSIIHDSSLDTSLKMISLSSLETPGTNHALT